MKNRIYIFIRILAAVLAIVWMVRIFSFSSDVAEVSGTVSRSMSYNMIEKISRHLHLGWDEEKIEAVSKPVEKYLRKAAHMYEYAVLAVLLGIAFDSSRIIGHIKRMRRHDGDTGPGAGRIFLYLLPIFICAVYSVTDEFHQTFVDGRSGELRDVCLDVSGAVIGFVLTVLIAYAIIKHIGEKRTGQPAAVKTAQEDLQTGKL